MRRDQRTNDHAPFEGLEVPGPPEVLRGPLLSAARQRASTPRLLDPWTRLWQSRVARVGWAVAVIGLLAANLGLGSRRSAPASRGGETIARRGNAELADVASLPRLRLDSLAPLSGSRGRGGDPDDDFTPRNGARGGNGEDS